MVLQEHFGVFTAPCVPRGRTASLHVTQARAAAKRRGAAPHSSPAPDRRGASSLGLEDGASDPAARRLDDQSRAHPRYLAPGGPQTPCEDAQASQGPGQKQRLRAAHAGQVWAIDFMFDETSDQRRLKLCNIVDEYTREALAIRVDRTCTAESKVCSANGASARRESWSDLTGSCLLCCQHRLVFHQPERTSPSTSHASTTSGV